MAETKKTRKSIKRNHRNHHSHPEKKQEKAAAPSWEALRIMFSCKHQNYKEEDNRRGKKKKKKCGRNVCPFSKPNIKESSMVVMKPRAQPSDSSKKLVMKVPLNEIDGQVSPISCSFSSRSVVAPSLSSSTSNSSRKLHLRRLSGCYECQAVVDPISGSSRNSSFRSTICSCHECGEIFMKPENLELHKKYKHAVTELGPEDTSRNIVEIIFQSSWAMKNQNQPPGSCTIERILKVNNTQRTIARFEEYRDAIKAKATRWSKSKKYPRCIADGNELLRFHCTTFTCSIGSNGFTSLCGALDCKLCSIVRNGFVEDEECKGIQTMGGSGSAHEAAVVKEPENEKRAMLVCRVIAGRVKNSSDDADDSEECDSMSAGLYSNLDKLFVFSSRAILPCFLVVYRTF